MKVVEIKKYGGPEVLKIKEITLRKPVNDEVLIEHAAIGLNYIDTYHRSGLYPLILPSALGLEASGIIKKIGPNVSNFSIGDKVAYSAVPLGAYSTHRIYKTKNLVKEKKIKEKDADTVILEKELSLKLGVKLTINDKNNKGNIKIEYRNIDQREKILNKLGRG